MYWYFWPPPTSTPPTALLLLLQGRTKKFHHGIVGHLFKSVTNFSLSFLSNYVCRSRKKPMVCDKKPGDAQKRRHCRLSGWTGGEFGGCFSQSQFAPNDGGFLVHWGGKTKQPAPSRHSQPEEEEEEVLVWWTWTRRRLYYSSRKTPTTTGFPDWGAAFIRKVQIKYQP